MKCLTLHQPWASLVATGVKRIETRSWRTDYQGPLAIHAGKTKGPLDAPWAPLCEPESIRLRPDIIPLPLGMVVATCWLTAVVPITGPNNAGHMDFVCPDIGGGLTHYRFGWGASQPATYEADITDQVLLGDWGEGRWAWILDDVKPLRTPEPATGRQGLWNWSPKPGSYDQAIMRYQRAR